MGPVTLHEDHQDEQPAVPAFDLGTQPHLTPVHATHNDLVEQSSTEAGHHPFESDESDMAGVVLCGGASRRMGVEKASLPLTAPDGAIETMLQRAARLLAEAGASPVLAAIGTPGRLGPLPWAEVDDGVHRGAGPLAGLLAALCASPHPLLAVLAVDLPDALPEVLQWLRQSWSPADRALIPVDPTGRPQPMHALYARDLSAEIDTALAGGERRVLRVLDAVGARYVVPPAAVTGRAWWRNVNHPSDRE